MANVFFKLGSALVRKSPASPLQQLFGSTARRAATAAAAGEVAEKEEKKPPMLPPNYRFVYPEFLPDPNLEFRNMVREKLERSDMLRRRTQVDIPEFYVGSVLAVTSSDEHAVGKTTRFVGICIQRRHCGLRADFTLRNVVDNQGVEIMYEIYDPRIQKVEVLRLEKRLDSELLYLRDADPEHSTLSFDMEAEFLTDDTNVPINPIKVKLRPPPWYARWERLLPKGAIIPTLSENRTFKSDRWLKNHTEPWEAHDLMKEYRRTIPEEEQKEIYADVFSDLHSLELQRKKMKRRKVFVKPKKAA